LLNCLEKLLTSTSDFSLILYSRLNDLSLGFQFHSSQEGVLPSVVGDPFVVHTPKRAQDRHWLHGVRNEDYFITVLFKEVEQAPPGNRNEYAPSSRLVKLFILDANLSVQESLFSVPLNHEGALQESDVPLSREALRLRRRNVGARRSRRAGFIVDDFDESTAVIESQNARAAAPVLLSPALFWTVDCTTAYLAVISGKMLSARRGHLRPLYDKGFKDCLENLKEVVLRPGKDCSGTLQVM
jgi:hypothetical protein